RSNQENAEGHGDVFDCLLYAAHFTSTPPNIQVPLIYRVGQPGLGGTMLSMPPRMEVQFTTTFTLSGTKMSMPPKMAETFRPQSWVIRAFRRSYSTPPNTALTSAPSKVSFSSTTV